MSDLKKQDVKPQKSSTYVSLIENPMKVFGLAGIGSSTTITDDQLKADPALSAKLERAVSVGFIKVE